MKIKEGGKISNLRAPINELRLGLTEEGFIELWIVDKEGNESLSFLTFDETIQLAHEVKTVLRDRINRI